jgi:hypothetical protein
MGDQPIVLAVASYASRAAAAEDFSSLWRLQASTRSSHLTAALVEKGTSGELEIDHYRSTADSVAEGVALLGGALTTIAAPLGITFLASKLLSSSDWAGSAAIVGRFWHEVARDRLRTMSNLLEAGQAGLIVVAVAHDREDVVASLSRATSKVVSDAMRLDLLSDFNHAAGPA